MPKPLIAAARSLADVLDRENLALRAMDLAGAAALLPEKTAAIADLVECEKTAPASGHPAPGDPALIPVARRLDGLAEENRGLLERAITAQQRVIGIVVRAAASVVANPSYGGRGRRPRLSAMALSTRV